jgi:hypothetical protein
MLDLKSYITEGVFDEDDIMDNIDNEVEINKWYKLLSNESTYMKGFDHLWAEIGQHNKEVKATQIPSLDGVFFMVEKYRPHSDDEYRYTSEYDENQWRLKIFWKHGGGNLYVYYQVIGYIKKDLSCRISKSEGAYGLKNIIQRKSKTNNIYARQIYQLSDEYKWVYKLMEKLYEKPNH